MKIKEIRVGPCKLGDKKVIWKLQLIFLSPFMNLIWVWMKTFEFLIFSHYISLFIMRNSLYLRGFLYLFSLASKLFLFLYMHKLNEQMNKYAQNRIQGLSCHQDNSFRLSRHLDGGFGLRFQRRAHMIALRSFFSSPPWGFLGFPVLHLKMLLLINFLFFRYLVIFKCEMKILRVNRSP